MGLRDETLNFGTTLKREGPMGDAVWWGSLCRAVQGVVLLTGCLRGQKAP